MTWPLEPSHDFHLTKRERRALQSLPFTAPVTSPRGPDTFSPAIRRRLSSLQQASLVKRLWERKFIAKGRVRSHTFGVYEWVLTDLGKQVLELYRVMESK